MGQISKAVGDWIVANVGWSVIILLFIISALFKITKIEINPLGWVISWIGKHLTKDVKNDIAKLSEETNTRFKEVKTDRAAKIEELKSDYNSKISNLTISFSDGSSTTISMNGFNTASRKTVQTVRFSRPVETEYVKLTINSVTAGDCEDTCLTFVEPF